MIIIIILLIIDSENDLVIIIIIIVIISLKLLNFYLGIIIDFFHLRVIASLIKSGPNLR